MRNHSNHLLLAGVGVVGFFLLAAFGVPVLASLPLLAFLVVCPLMMFFMMRGMGHGGGHDDESSVGHDDSRDHSDAHDSSTGHHRDDETAGTNRGTGF